MSNVISRMPISLRVAFLCLIPMLALLGVGSKTLFQERSIATKSRTVSEVIAVAPIISGLVHELQKERGTSAGFIGSGGKRFVDVIGTRRADTNAALEKYTATIPNFSGELQFEAYVQPFTRATRMLTELEDQRAAVDRLGITVPEMASYYTPLISQLLAMVESVSKITNDGELGSELTAYSALLQGKERAGIERAMGAAGFGSGQFKPHVHKRFLRLGAMQDSFFKIFRDHSAQGNVEKLDQALSGAEQAEVLRLRKLAEGAPFGLDISGVSGPDWFGASTRRIDLLKTVEDAVAAGIVQIATEKTETAQSSFWSMAGILAMLLIASFVLCVIVAKSIVTPITNLADRMLALARNDVSIEVVEATRSDEIGHMGKAVEVFRDHAIERQKLERENQVDRDRELQRQSIIDNLVASFRKVAAGTVQSVEDQTMVLKNSAEGLSSVAHNASKEATSADGASQDASRYVENVASATKQLAASTQEISQRAQDASAKVSQATEITKSTDRDVSALAEATTKIGTVVELIRDIAEQTNLLALNATIEAARAGEMGKGFAVVASEVKTLASETAKATEEIGNQIESVQELTTNAVTAVRQVFECVNDIDTVTGSIAAAVEEQKAATDEISSSIHSASKGTGQVASNVQSVSSAIDKTAEEAESLKETSTALTGAMEDLTQSVDGFLTEVEQDVVNRRATLRHKMSQVIIISANGERLKSQLHDISEGGAQISAVDGVAEGSSLSVEFANGVTTEGKVVRSQNGLLGISFSKDLSDLHTLLAA